MRKKRGTKYIFVTGGVVSSLGKGLAASSIACILLMGIAGTFLPEEHPVAEARVFTRVAIDGIGAGSGRDFTPPSGLGFPQWPGNPEGDSAPTAGPGSDPAARSIGEELELAHPAGTPAALLLTTCAASNSDVEVAERLERHPDALAEDMEGFGVALACALGGVPLAIVRGFSNRVGDRDATHWSIPAALASARRVAEDVLRDAHWERVH